MLYTLLVAEYKLMTVRLKNRLPFVTLIIVDKFLFCLCMLVNETFSNYRAYCEINLDVLCCYYAVHMFELP